MKKVSYHTELIPLDKVFLDLENPRHEPVKQQKEAIEYLCNHEYVLQLAQDIAKNGLSPLDPFGLLTNVKNEETYIVAEGNRRICALKLLDDPDLAPTPLLKKQFQMLSETWQPLSVVPAVVFNSKDDLSLWLDRTHGGLQGGIGRKQWSSEQKARHTGHKKSQLAQLLLDEAEKLGFIDVVERKGKLTTAQRFLDNSTFREALGIDKSNPEDVRRRKSKNDFNKMLKQFVTDLVEGRDVNSRKNKTDIENYARSLTQVKGVSGKYLEEPEPLIEVGVDAPGKKSKPVRPNRVTRIGYSDKLHAALRDIPSYKLEKIYYSICAISLLEHTPLVAVGAWSFLETITALNGRDSKTSFVAYLSSNKLQNLGLGDGKKTKGMQDALNRISTYGNTTKHDQTAAAFHNEQLANDMDVLVPLLIRLAEGAQK